MKFTAGYTPRLLCLQNWSTGTWRDDSDTTALFTHFRLAFTFLWLLLGKHRKSYVTKWGTVTVSSWLNIHIRSWLLGREHYSLRAFAFFLLSLTSLLAWLQMCCLFFRSQKQEWPIRSFSASHSQCRVVLCICPLCFYNSSNSALHPS